MSDTFSAVSQTLADQTTLAVDTPGSISDPNFSNDVATIASLTAISPDFFSGDLQMLDNFEQQVAGWYANVQYYASIDSPVDPAVIAAQEANFVSDEQFLEKDLVQDVNVAIQDGYLTPTTASLFPIDVSPDGTPGVATPALASALPGVVAPRGPNGDPTVPRTDPNSMPDPTVPGPGLVSEGLGPLIPPTPANVGIAVAVGFQNTFGPATQYAADRLAGKPQSALAQDFNNTVATLGSDAIGFIAGKIAEGASVPINSTTQATPAVLINNVGGVEVGNGITDGINSVLNQKPNAFQPPSPGPGVTAPAGPPSVPQPAPPPAPASGAPGVTAPIGPASLGLSSEMRFLNSPSVNPATFDVATSGPTSSIAINNVMSAVATLASDPTLADFPTNVSNLAIANMNAQFAGAELAILHGASYPDVAASLTNNLATMFKA